MSEKKQSIGALWSKQGRNGDYLSGNVEINGVKHNIICFINGFKELPKHPDYQIYKSEPRPEQQPEPEHYVEPTATDEDLADAELEYLAGGEQPDF